MARASNERPRGAPVTAARKSSRSRAARSAAPEAMTVAVRGIAAQKRDLAELGTRAEAADLTTPLAHRHLTGADDVEAVARFPFPDDHYTVSHGHGSNSQGQLLEGALAERSEHRQSREQRRGRRPQGATDRPVVRICVHASMPTTGRKMPVATNAPVAPNVRTRSGAVAEPTASPAIISASWMPKMRARTSPSTLR